MNKVEEERLIIFFCLRRKGGEKEEEIKKIISIQSMKKKIKKIFTFKLNSILNRLNILQFKITYRNI